MVVGYVIAVVMLFSVSFFKIVVLLFPLWVAAVSLVILFAARVPDGRESNGRTVDPDAPATS